MGIANARPRRRSLLLLVAVVLGLVPSVARPPIVAHATDPYASAVLADSPVVYYRLGDSSGTTATDSSGNSHNATYDGSVTLGNTPSATATSDANTAVSLSGSGTPEPVSRDDSVLPTGDSDRTAEVWFKTTTSANQTLMQWGSYNSVHVNHFFGIHLLSSSAFRIYEGGDFGGATNHKDFTVLKTLTDGDWHMLAVTFDHTLEGTGNPLKLYVDGGLEGAGTFPDAGPINTDSSVDFSLGAQADGETPLTGKLDEAAVYSSVLSRTRIAAHYDANLPGTAASPSGAYATSVVADSPAAYYRLGESSGSTALDSSGNGVNAHYESAATLGTTASGTAITDTDKAISVAGSGVPLVRSSTGLPTGDDARSEEIWFKTSTTASFQVLTSYGSYWEGNPNHWFGISLNTSGNVTVTEGGGFGGANNGIALTPTVTLRDGNWHMVAVTFNPALEGSGNPVSLYNDGALAATGAFPDTGPLATDPTSFSIGAETDGEYPFTGSLDEVAVYSSVLSGSRIKAHFLASGRQMAPTGGNVAASELYGNGTNATHTCSSAGVAHGQGADPVDTESGNFSETFTDVAINGRSCPLAITRTYNAAAAATNGPFGYGWTYNYALSLSCASTTATVTQENGSQVTFTTSGNCSSGSWTPTAPRFLATLVHNGGGTWTFVRQGRDTYTFNSSGQLTAITDLNGYSTSLTYTTSKLTSVTDPAGRTLALGWTGSNITSVTDANVSPNRTVSYSYDGSGDLTDVTDVDSGVTHFTYSSHLITVMKDPVCQAVGGGCPGVQNHYDGNSRVDWQKNQLDKQTDFVYAGMPGTAAGGTTTITDPVGNAVVTGYQYGVRTFETRGYGTGDAATTYLQYDPDTLALTGIIDPNKNTTTMTVDSSGNVLTKTDPLGRVTTTAYNAFNEPLTIQDGKGVTTTMTYDGNGNLATVSTPASGGSCTCAVTTYNRANGTYPGDVTSIDDPNGKTTYFHFDGNGYVDQVKNPLGKVSGTEYNAIGWVKNTWTPKAACTWNSSPPTGCSSTYKTVSGYGSDEFGDVQTITDPLSHVTTLGYDADRRKTSVQDGNGNTTTFTFDVAGQLTTTTRPDTTTQITDYNDDGTVLDQKDGAGTAIQTYGYDHLARVTTVTDGLSNVTTYSHDANGNVLTKMDPSGSCPSTKCTSMTYDAGNQLATVSYSDGVTPNVSAITYDNDGQRTAMTDGTGSSSWSWDNLHRLTSYTSGNGDTVTYGYGSDLKNQVGTIAYPNSVGTVTQTWSDDGTLASVQDWNAKTTTFGYDDNANQTSQVSPSTTNVTDTFGFNAADQMTSISASNGSTLLSATYTRDSNGQLASDSSQAANQANYKYTSLNQLCYAGSGTANACSSAPANSYPYAFDAADNLTKMEDAGHGGYNTQKFNAADQLCWTVSGASGNACNSAPGGATTYGYDDRGNRTYALAASGTCNAYDQANRLTSVKTGTGSSCTSPTTLGTYAYDGSGLRQSKTVTGTTTQFTWDMHGALPLLLQGNAGGTKTSYIYGPGGLPVEQIAGATTTYLHHDQIGSIRLITDSAGNTGTATTQSWDPYGNVVSTSGALTTNLGFSGEYRDAETGLYYLRARYYDPATAQFLTLDPAVSSTGSPYAYVAGNPLNATDPSGLISRDRLSQDQQHELEQACSRYQRSSLCLEAAFCASADECHGYAQLFANYYGEVENAIAHCHDGQVTLEEGYTESAKAAEKDLSELKTFYGQAKDSMFWHASDDQCRGLTKAGMLLTAVGFVSGVGEVAVGVKAFQAAQGVNKAAAGMQTVYAGGWTAPKTVIPALGSASVPQCQG